MNSAFYRIPVLLRCGSFCSILIILYTFYLFVINFNRVLFAPQIILWTIWFFLCVWLLIYLNSHTLIFMILLIPRFHFCWIWAKWLGKEDGILQMNKILAALCRCCDCTLLLKEKWRDGKFILQKKFFLPLILSLINRYLKNRYLNLMKSDGFWHKFIFFNID